MKTAVKKETTGSIPTPSPRIFKYYIYTRAFLGSPPPESFTIIITSIIIIAECITIIVIISLFRFKDKARQFIHSRHAS